MILRNNYHTYSFVTYSKINDYFLIILENDFEQEDYLKIKFLPNKNIDMIFSADKIDLQMMKLRDPEVVLSIFEEYGLTMIVK